MMEIFLYSCLTTHYNDAMVTANSSLFQALIRSGARKVLMNEPLSRHTSFRIGGPARFWVEAGDAAALNGILKVCHAMELSWYILGGGSNVLVPDDGFDGVIIHLTDEFTDIKVSGETLTAGSGAHMSRLARSAQAHGLSGLEFAAGIPGTLGGALVGNAGTATGQIGDLVQSVTVLTPEGTVVTHTRENLSFLYRRTSLKHSGILVSCELHLKHGDRDRIAADSRQLLEKRKASQPLNKPSAGCIFRNPPFEKAGRLIDRAGIKGWREGSAQVSDRHANFIINMGNARASDVMTLINRIQARVNEQFGIRLDLEIELLQEAH